MYLINSRIKWHKSIALKTYFTRVYHCQKMSKHWNFQFVFSFKGIHADIRLKTNKFSNFLKLM